MKEIFIPERLPRHRSRGSLTQYPLTVSWSSYNAAATPPTVSYSDTRYTGKVENMYDYVQPLFDRLIAEGVIVNNTMRKESQETLPGSTVGPKWTYNSGGANLNWDYGQNWMAKAVGWPTTVLTPMVGYQDLLTEVETRARAGILQPDFEGLVALGELRENIKYLANPFKTGLKLVSNFYKKSSPIERRLTRQLRQEGIKGTVRSEKSINRLSQTGGLSTVTGSTLKTLSDLYLELRFGLIPLVNDASNLALALTGSGKFPRLTSRSKSSRVEVSTVSGSTKYLGVQYNYVDTIQNELTIRSFFLYEHTLVSERSRLGLSLSEIPRTMWELIPLSFLVDRFLNVGSFINSLTLRSGVTILASGTSITQTQTITRQFGTCTNIDGPFVAPWVLARQPSGSLRTVSIIKTRTDHIDAPGLTFRTDNIRSMAQRPLELLDLLTLSLQRLL